MIKIAEYLSEKYSPWGWMGQRAHDAAGINRVLPLDFIVSCAYGREIPYYFAEEDVFSIEKETRIRKNWSNEDLAASLEGDLGRKVFQRWNSYGKKVNLLCYRSVECLEKGPVRLKYKPTVYAPPERLKTYFDNKILLYKSLPKLSLPKIPGITAKLKEVDFDDISQRFSLPFVVQFPYGSTGEFTFIIREEGVYNNLQRNCPDSSAVIRRYIDGYSLNVNAVIVSTARGCKTYCSFPSVQVVGVPECTKFESVFCGNDFTLARFLDKKVIKQVERCVQIIGKWMASSGYRGIFGMDFVANGGKVYPIEINPRFQNSTALFTTLSTMQKRAKGTLFLLHIAEFLQDKDKVMKEYLRKFPYEELMNPLNGSQVILHSGMRRKIVTGNFIPGVYRLKNDRLEFIREGATLEACKSDKETLVTCGLPRRYTRLEPGAPICKVEMRKNVLEPGNKRRLTNDTKRVVKAVYKKLGLENYDRA